MSDTTKEQPEAVAPVAETQPVKDEVAPVNSVKEEDVPVADNTEIVAEGTTEKPAEEKTKVISENKTEAKPATTANGTKRKAKSDASTLPVTDDPIAIRTQVCFVLPGLVVY